MEQLYCLLHPPPPSKTHNTQRYVIKKKHQNIRTFLHYKCSTGLKYNIGINNIIYFQQDVNYILELTKLAYINVMDSYQINKYKGK